MENASRALIIAGGILLGIIIASLFAYEMFSVAQTGKTYQAKINMEDTYEFNAQFTKFINIDLSAQDVISILNFVYEWNMDNESDAIEIEKINIPGVTLDIQKISRADLSKMNIDILSDYGTKDNIFRLYIKGYDYSGRINKISFVCTKQSNNEFTVTFNANGGSVSPNTVKVKANKAIREYITDPIMERIQI